MDQRMAELVLRHEGAAGRAAEDRMSSQLMWLATIRVAGRGRAPTSVTRAPTIQAASARNRRGQPDRPTTILVAM